MAKELIRDFQGACSTLVCQVRRIFPGVVDPFLNLSGRDWDILDRRTGTKALTLLGRLVSALR
jgi:hypothetical protein